MRTSRAKVLVPIGVRPHACKAACLTVVADQFDVDITYLVTGQQSDILGRILSEEQSAEINARSIFATEPFSYQSATALIADIASNQGYQAVLSIGDTKTSLCAAMGAKIASVSLIHYESGLRGGTMTIEEIIRRKIDRMSDLQLCYNGEAMDNLLSEGTPHDQIRIVGSLYEESLGRSLSSAGKYDGRYLDFALVTLHRKENRLNAATAKVIASAASKLGRKVLFVKHPSNSEAMLSIFKQMPHAWVVHEEFSADRFAHILQDVSCVITDSAGISEQASLMSLPTVLLRTSTERPWLLNATTRLASFEDLYETAANLLSLPQREISTGFDLSVSSKILHEVCEFIKRDRYRRKQ
ncbi:UDP-N-acetylglucosamine 2-epimerase [Rhizobium sp. PP-WC-1G-195]|nr:UDP-N-acetylglucosamine 2-epimerase [Rhizobium sp. PP-WC-1G-195]